MSNARKPYHQLSSCFVDTVPDSLDGIYHARWTTSQRSLNSAVEWGCTSVRCALQAAPSAAFKGRRVVLSAWIRLVNDTAVAVDQLGMRQGAVAVLLNAWHQDLPEFLQLRTNNGDDRMKAHDVFPAVAIRISSGDWRRRT